MARYWDKTLHQWIEAEQLLAPGPVDLHNGVVRAGRTGEWVVHLPDGTAQLYAHDVFLGRCRAEAPDYVEHDEPVVVGQPEDEIVVGDSLDAELTRLGTTQAVLGAVRMERRRQNLLWSQDNHPPEVWLAILTEEVGEVAKEIAHGHGTGIFDRRRYRQELIQVAAVAVRAIEVLDAERAGHESGDVDAGQSHAHGADQDPAVAPHDRA